MRAALTDLFFGQRCIGCDKPGHAWCKACLRGATSPAVMQSPSGLFVAAASHYIGSVSHAVVAYKEHAHLALAAPLGKLLSIGIATLVGQCQPPSDVRSDLPTTVQLVWVPSSPAAVRRRGNDHMRRLTREARKRSSRGQLRGWELTTSQGAGARPVLSWNRSVRDQGSLSAAGRRTNVSRAMTARSPGRGNFGRPVILLDDIVTTGASLHEAARALAASQWQVLGAAVVARVPFRSADSRLIGAVPWG